MSHRNPPPFGTLADVMKHLDSANAILLAYYEGRVQVDRRWLMPHLPQVQAKLDTAQALIRRIRDGGYPV